MSNLVTAHDWGYYFIYLTNWGILMCMITGIYGAILVSKWYFHTEYSGTFIILNVYLILLYIYIIHKIDVNIYIAFIYTNI